MWVIERMTWNELLEQGTEAQTYLNTFGHGGGRERWEELEIGD